MYIKGDKIRSMDGLIKAQYAANEVGASTQVRYHSKHFPFYGSLKYFYYYFLKSTEDPTDFH